MQFTSNTSALSQSVRSDAPVDDDRDRDVWITLSRQIIIGIKRAGDMDPNPQSPVPEVVSKHEILC